MFQKLNEEHGQQLVHDVEHKVFGSEPSQRQSANARTKSESCASRQRDQAASHIGSIVAHETIAESNQRGSSSNRSKHVTIFLSFKAGFKLFSFQELTAENRLLKSLHKRQDSALSKYENTSAELPQLLHSHAEEVRVWQTRCRNFQRQNKELIGKIKQKDSIVLTLSDQNKHLLQLNKDKNLEEREKLADRVRDLEQRLLDKDGDMKLLARRLQLESKAYKSNLYMEQQKYRDLISKIELSEYMIQRPDNGDKKSLQKPLRQRQKSPPRVHASRSAASLTNGNDLILPPCDGQEVKKHDETAKTNSPRINVNPNVKLLPDDSEVDLTKNRYDMSEKIHKNGHDDDEITVTIRNGMNRAKITQKPAKVTAKLTPLHPKQETKKSSDDSEFSDSDFTLFSKHNGTKMVTTMSPFVVRESKNVVGVYLSPFSWTFA